MDKEIFELIFDEEKMGVFAISFVSNPANKLNFHYFNDEKPLYFVEDEEKRIVFGNIMVADTPILRKPRLDLNIEDYHYVVFSKETIEKLALNYLKNGFQHNATAQHRYIIDGVTLFESFTTDENIVVKGYEDIPIGSWFGKFKVENDTIWNEIKNGTFKGFSIEAELTYNFEDEELEYYKKVYNKLINKK